MSLIADIGLGVAQGALRGALHPFAEAGDLTSSQADTISAGAVDLLKTVEAAAAHPPTIEAELRALFDPLVTAGDVTGPKADEIVAAIMDSVGLGEKLASKPGAGPAGDTLGSGVGGGVSDEPF